MLHPRWHKTFLGVRQQHCYGLYEVIDLVLLENPQICRFVETGTGGGALSVILALHAAQRGSHLLTFDKQERGHLHKVLPLFDRLGVEMHQIDSLSREAQMTIADYVGNHPCFFFIDTDDKPEEFNLFAPMLPKGSVVAVHDYDTWEIRPGQIEETVNLFKLQPLHRQAWTGGVDDIRTCFYGV